MGTKQKQFVDLYTEEGEKLSGVPWEIYPRPQMRRDSFFNLNGMWDFAMTVRDTQPEQYNQKIRVPFPLQSLLSGIHHVRARAGRRRVRGLLHRR